jgi:hypothetical protein
MQHRIGVAVQDRGQRDPVTDTRAPAALMPFQVLGEQRLREVPQRIRAVLLHVTHARSTNDVADQHAQMRCGLR